MVFGSEECPIAGSTMLVLDLHTGGLEMAFSSPSLLIAIRTSIDSAVAAVIADAIHGDIVDHGSVVDMNVVDPDIVDAAVVEEVPTSPVSAGIAGANVAESVIHAAVETDVRSPIARIPDIDPFMPTPIARRPEQADRRRRRPRAGHPEVAVRAVGPIAGRPDITVAGTRRLLINRQRRRGDRD